MLNRAIQAREDFRRPSVRSYICVYVCIVTAYHSYLRLSALADFAQHVDIYSLSENSDRESTLWISG